MNVIGSCAVRTSDTLEYQGEEQLIIMLFHIDRPHVDRSWPKLAGVQLDVWSFHSN